MTNYLDILSETIRKNWDQPALTDFYLTEDGTAQDTSRGNHYTYGEMYAEIVRIADLLTNLGLQKGDHIAICGVNSAHWVIAYLAIAKMQGVSVTVMHSLQPNEIAQMIDFSDAKALFVDTDLWDELRGQSLPQVESVIALDNWDVLRGEIIINHQSSIINEGCRFPHSEPDSLAMICFTSSSAGNPKGVMLSNMNVSNNARNGSNSYPNKSGNNNYLSIIPLAHVLGLYGDLLGQLLNGRHIHFLLHISILSINRSIKEILPFAMNLTPTILYGLLSIHEENTDWLKPFEQIYVGGASIDKSIESLFLKNNIKLSSGYGLTETGPISWAIGNNSRQGTCGKIVEGMTCRISPNGEILVKGENVMLGYYKDPEATAQKIDKDGWLHTGDKGHLDEDGYLYVEGRLEQDMIVLPNGENIRPENIERLIDALPEVSESIVLARNGHLVALVVPKSPLALGEGKGVRLSVLRAVNPQLPLFSQLYDVEITDVPLQRTEKQTLKRYLYK